MATSSAMTTTNQRINYSITVTQNSQSVENNTSNVTVSVRFWRTNTGYETYGNGTVYCTIDGTEYTAAVTSSQKITNSGIVLFTKTLTIAHASDGKKTLTCSAYIKHSQFSSSSQSYSQALTTIARASQPSCVTWPDHTQNVGNFGDEIAIHMNRKANTFTHTVRYQFGSQSGTIATGVTNSTMWTIPLSLMNLIPSAVSGSGTIYVDTYNGSTLIGTKSCGFTATVPSSVKPSATLTLEDVNGIDDIYGSPVQGLSKIKITVNTTVAYSSPIASYAISADGVNYTTNGVTTGVLQKSGTSRVSATVKDNRGRSGSVYYDMNVQAYTAPTVTALTVRRCDSDGTLNAKGEYAQVTFSGAVTPLDNLNTARYKVRYKQTTASTWTEATFSTLNDVYTVTDHTYIFAANGNNSYNVEITVTDRHGSYTRSTSVSTAFTLTNWHSSGTGIRFGGVAEKANTFQNDLEFIQRANRYTFSSAGVAGSAGYILMAQLTHKKANADTPITFVFSQRLQPTPMTVHVQFKSNSTTVDPDLLDITYEGTNYGAFLVKAAESVWNLYVQKVSAYDTITLQDWYSSGTLSDRMTVTFAGTLVETLPSPYYRATPAKLDSLLDHIYPVNSIYISYSHTSPAELFGGTWTRVENRFLWATTSGGTIGGTGGAQTHTLTENEMPKHTHGMMYQSTGATSSRVGRFLNGTYGYGSDAVEATTGTSYITYRGGDAAHNNMPPYIQVSIWRRTA